MEQSTQTIIVGGREFTVHRMNAFAANKLLMRIQKVVVPVLGSLMGGAGAKSLADVDVEVAARALSTHLDEALFDTIVLPMFEESKLFLNEKKAFIRTGVDISQNFTTQNLFDLYELIFEIGRFQFGPFFESAVARFGAVSAAKK